MSEALPEKTRESAVASADDTPQAGLEQGTYEIVRGRLEACSGELTRRLDQLNAQRRDVFGSIPTQLLATDRITTSNNCTPRDIVAVGDLFVFGFNVHLGLKSETNVSDVFAVYRFSELSFHEESLDLLSDANFQHDFRQLYKYFKGIMFRKFHVIGPYLYMVFQVGPGVSDFKTLKWLVDGKQIRYVDNRSDHEVQFPEQHEFEWIRTHRDLHRSGAHPHISIEDRVFVETVGGDLTIKVEDNTDDGHGIYREPVDDADQTLDDAEIFYAGVGNIILLKIRPFKEQAYRYFVFNEKIQRVMRLDSLERACILLPEDHGLIFSNGFYLQTGQYKTFETNVEDLLYERTIISPNGEDFLYVFYNVSTGTYVLLSYNMILQQVATPIICHGFSTFANGHLIYFKSDGTPQKHHVLQIWQTPFVAKDLIVSTQSDSYLFKIGNKDIVRGMAECHEIIGLIGQDESFADLYMDLVKKSTNVLDSYFWLASPETFNLAETLGEIKQTASAAVAEFEKVVRIRANTEAQSRAVFAEAKQIIGAATGRMYRSIDEFVETLATMRQVRGKVVSLKDLKYADVPAIDQLEKKIQEQTEHFSKNCVQFLLRNDSLKPYLDRVATQRQQIDPLETTAHAKQLDKALASGSSELEMLIEIVSNLQIDDATHRTQIIDNISAIYSQQNQARALLKKKIRNLQSQEGAAEFSSQLKLLSQAVVNYLEVCDSPERCDEYLTKLMVQVEELEGRFAEFDEFVVQLADKRDEIYSAFDAKRLQIVEARQRRATSLMNAAERILKGIEARLGNLETVDEVNSYFATDMMIQKVRDLVQQLKDLEESVKVDDVQSRLKTIREEAVRQLRDKQELFVDGQNAIKLGRHTFNVNAQPLDLTTVVKDGFMAFHLTGTNYSERIDVPEIQELKPIWDQALVSENADVYRGEFLAYQLLKAASEGDFTPKGLPTAAAKAKAHVPKALIADVQHFMAVRYAEGYIKGVHDHDAAAIFRELAGLQHNLGLLRYPARARALAIIFWSFSNQPTAGGQAGEPSAAALLSPVLESVGRAQVLFGDPSGRQEVVSRVARQLSEFQTRFAVGRSADCQAAAEFLFDELSQRTTSAGRQAIDLVTALRSYLNRQTRMAEFEEGLADLPSLEHLFVVRQWLSGFVKHQKLNYDSACLEEASAIIFDGSFEKRTPLDGSTERQLTGMLGDHPRCAGGTYTLDYPEFTARLNHFEAEAIPAFHRLGELKQTALQRRRESLRLDEFKPRVLSSFVRNRLVNDVYLPVVGDNLAKQIGVAGESKRTDLMGLLLLISPPGYGKTTLMEYISSRLGLIFMKINGPAIGHQVTSLDPAEAPNASAREQVEKLNLALEMGDNVMIYVDDIQHCHPEFLQKFISLCDATRRIEGVFRGKTKTYDLRGRKVCVVMAGNPYTESGEKFQIPDMLSNRSDTYNLGDVIGDNQQAFELSYLENCLTSNPTLNHLHTRNREDVYNIIRMAQHDESPGEMTLEGNFSIEEIREFVSVFQKLIRIRSVVLDVNQLYIKSAAQADAYRTEPAFKLQGSYRDMNKMAERVVPIMNNEELEAMITSHYESQAQTLTTDAEANLLKLAELRGRMTPEQRQRWSEITSTFKRNVLLGSVEGDDKVAQIIAQMTTFSQGLIDIRTGLDQAVERLTAGENSEAGDSLQAATISQIGHVTEQLSQFNNTLGEIKNLVQLNVEQAPELRQAAPQKIQVINKVPQSFANIIHSQFRVLQTWMEPILRLCEALPEAKQLKKSAELTAKQYQKLIDKVESSEPPGSDAAPETDE